MKSYGKLWEQYLTEDNLRKAIHDATRPKHGKARNRRAKWLRDNQDKYVKQLMTYAANYHNMKHTPKMIYDGISRKQRAIIVPTLREQVVHNMVINVLKPIFMKSMYAHSYGSIPGRGSHKGAKAIRKRIDRNGKNCKYCLKMDIHKYFDSIPKDILLAKLRKLIRDKRFFAIVKEIVNVTEHGIPLGFYTSQWFANWYLTDLDHYIKEILHAKHYMRYMDDMVIFGSNKRKLHSIRRAVAAYLSERLGLSLKDNWQVFRFSYIKRGKDRGRDLDFMGFRFYRNRTILRKQILYRITAKACKMAKTIPRTVFECRQMISYLGVMQHVKVHGVFVRRVKPYVSAKAIKKRISAHERKYGLCGLERRTAAA